MRIKYSHKIMFYFLAILMVTFTILTVLFNTMTSNMLYRNTIADLTSYANSMINDFLTERDTGFIIHKYSDWLNSRNIQFLRFEGTEIQTGDGFSINISEEQFDQFYSGTTITGVTTTKNNETICFVMVPKVFQNTFLTGVALYSPVSGLEQTTWELMKNLLTAFFVSLIAAFLLSYFFAKSQVKQFRKMSEAAHQIQMGNYDIQIESQSNDEIGDLANDFNAMSSALKESNLEIERQERRRRQLISDVSHELRTPLTTINGILEGLEYNMIPESKKESSIKLMQEETQRLIRLVNKNLDYDKLRSNQITLHKVEVNIYNAFHTVKSQLGNNAAIKGNRIEIKAEQSLTAYADYDRLIQILVNLGQNAIQFTENGTITFSAYKKYHSLYIEIADTGIGMRKEEMEKIWDRFYKADTSRKNMPYGESGLGLAIVKQLVSMHGGSIEVNSVLNEGTTMRVILPINSKF